MLTRDLSRWFAEAKADDNPYLTEWFAVASLEERMTELFATDRVAWDRAFRKSCEDGTHEHAARRTLTAKYAWAVPCEEALTVLAELSPLIEIGAGAGYWAWLLRKRGVDVLAFDERPPPDKRNHWHGENQTWTRVERGGPGMVQLHPDRTLFLCWPPYDRTMAADCLRNYRGRTLAFVGEGDGGCTADGEFFKLLDQGWEESRDVLIPQYDGIHDYLTVYEWRKT